MIVGALALVVVGVIAIIPPEAPKPSDPSFIDSIFANRFVIFTARLLLLAGAIVAAFAATYVMSSIVVRMRRGQWLRRTGPFEVSEEAVASLSDEIDLWKGLAQDAEEEIEALKERLRDTEEVAEQFYDRVRDLERELGERSP